MPLRKLKLRPSPSQGTKLRLKPTPRFGKKPEREEQRPKRGGFLRGVAGFKRAHILDEEYKRRRENSAFRFRLKVGDEGKVIVLDKEPRFIYEHNWKGPDGFWNKFEVCRKDSGICPLCQKLGREGSYVMLLTVIDLRPYKTRDGKKVKFSRKLMPVKSSMIKKFERIYKKYGSFRGVMLNMQRDNAKGTAIGDSFEFVKRLSETGLSQYGKEAKIINYDEAFPYPTEKQLKQKYGSMRVAGNEDTEDEDEDLENVDWDDADKDDATTDSDDEDN